ncbi:ABC transporter ATP-binding protein [Oceanibacterium hippocampi]|uniref:Sulfate/thiosulfate import ATP-binding protein CysA n=1 Tax=Oceanibacterium hippocampi TaxID=745714 RepID=A0A1Y5RN05_9PROT|nr:ABC transporter ATP-binding protein [Oceanibacterium hippocampi]SLN21293.1 Sulfate/thiosulfate import ATP-binding protein CysA [Oceanibacterium hippocampi]
MSTNEPIPPSAVAVDRLSKNYDGILAVDEISFTVPAGSVMALLGGNGAGKTTTISMLLGLLTPTSGGITVLGHDMLADRYAVLPRMNFSSPYVDLPHRLSVRQNLLVYARLYGIARPRERVEQLAEALDLTGFLGRWTGQLSAGQKTRVALAKALINQPDLLLLDEPTASLDPDTGDWVRQYLKDYQAKTRATILLASHNMAEVERLADHVLMMRAGRIVDRGAPAALLARYGRNNLEEVFLDIARDRRRAVATVSAAGLAADDDVSVL